MGSIYITGDCHGDWNRFSTRNFPQQKELTREDYVIVCGDFGLWHDTTEERKKLDWLAEKRFTLLFVDGNHENFTRLYGDEFEEVDFYGGRAHRIRENIYHLMRGHVFELCGKRIFAFGGASSHDIEDGIIDPAAYTSEDALKTVIRRLAAKDRRFRIKGATWWREELPDEEEMERGRRSLEEYGNAVDIIVTHCGPQRVIEPFLDEEDSRSADCLTEYFDSVNKTAAFEHWYFGHYHADARLSDRFTLVYNKIIKIS